MSRIAYIAGALGEGGKPSGRAVTFNRWLPLFAAVADRQGGWAVEALTIRRCRGTKFRRLNVAARPPIQINCASEATPSPMRNVQPRAVRFTPNQHKVLPRAIFNKREAERAFYEVSFPL